jgi:hypothetical protein
MTTKRLVTIIILLIVAAGSFALYRAAFPPAPKPKPSFRPHAVERDVIALPNGATIVAAPASFEAQIVAYLESDETAPRRVEPGAEDFRPWVEAPTPRAQAKGVALAQILKAYPQATVEIIGNTDNDGTREQNQALSLQRARLVVQRLADYGISQRRLSASGVGMDNPVADNGTEAGRALNRRITFVIHRLGKDDD